MAEIYLAAANRLFKQTEPAFSDVPILNMINMEIEAGRCVGLSGPNGAGKTTLVRIMLDLYRPKEGHIFADNVAYEELDITTLRRQIGVVPQFPLLFDGTIADNIGYCHPGASRADLERAAMLAGAQDFIGRLSAGYATRIGDTGSLLSGGERQRIAIARALVGTPRLLVFDEPLNHLAPSALEPILARLRDLPAMPSSLLISHNMEAIRLADAHYCLRNGHLSEETIVTQSARAKIGL